MRRNARSTMRRINCAVGIWPMLVLQVAHATDEPPTGPWTYYDDFAEWENAVGSYTTFDFVVPPDHQAMWVNEAWASQGLHLSAQQWSSTYEYGVFGAWTATDTDHSAVITNTSFSAMPLVFNFDTPITSFAWWSGVSNPWIHAYSVDGTINGWVADNSDGLGGLVFDVPVYRVITYRSMSDMYLTYVPAPSALALLGLCGLRGSSRRRR